MLTVENYEEFKAKSHLPSITEIGQRYYEFCLKVHEEQNPKEKDFSFWRAFSFCLDDFQFRIEQRLG